MASMVDWLLLNAVVAAALALVIWLATWIPAVRRRPGLRHALWMVVLLKLVTPPVIGWPVLPASEKAATKPSASPSEPVAVRETPVFQPNNDVEIKPTAVREDSAPNLQRQAIPASDPPASVAVTSKPFDWRVLLIGISLVGTAVVLAMCVRQVMHLRCILQHGATNDSRLTRIAAESAKSMGLATPPEVAVASGSISPLLWVRRTGPLVVLPRRLVQELTDEQLGCVISHEIAHYQRRDHWTNLFSLLAVALFWWHPVAWWGRRSLRTAQEACCDTMVISRSVAPRRVYAGTLLHALEFLQTERPLLPASASGFGSKSSTRRRFEMIANPRVNHRLSWWCYPVLLAAVAVLPCLPTAGLAQKGNDKGRDKDKFKDKGKPRVEVRGELKSVNAEKGTITLRSKKTDSTTYHLAKNAQVYLDNGEGKKGAPPNGKLSDLTEGLSVTLRLGEDKKVTMIRAEGPTLHGILKAADEVSRTITVALAKGKGDPAANKTFNVAKNAAVSVFDGKVKDKLKPVKPLKLSDLLVESVVRVKLSPDRKVVVNIYAEGHRISGRVKSVDATKRSITIVIARKGVPNVERTFSVEKSAGITVDDGKSKDKFKAAKKRALADVPVGAPATLQLSLDGKSVVSIHAHGASLSGGVKAVDAAKRTLTIQNKGKNAQTLTAADDVAVYLDGKDGISKLSDVPVGAFVHVQLQADRQLVRTIRVFGPSVTGRVVGAAINNTVTLRDKQGETSYTLSDKTRFAVEGKKSGTLSDLIEGTMVRLRLSVDKAKVLEVHAEGPRYEGRVKSYNPEKKTLTLTIGGKDGVGGKDTEFLVTKATRIYQKSSKLRLKPTKLQPGSRVNLRLTIDQKSADWITILTE